MTKVTATGVGNDDRSHPSAVHRPPSGRRSRRRPDRTSSPARAPGAEPPQKETAMTAPTAPFGGVVVGVDGSSRAGLAVDWGAAEAVRRGTSLHLVHAFEMVDSLVANDLMSPAEARATGQQICAAAERHARGTHPGLAVTSEVRLARPAATLVEASRHAALVVVGARGRGAVRGQLLGSTSRHLAARAHGPVVVIRHPTGGAGRPVVVGVDRAPRSTAALTFALDDATRRGVAVRAVHSTRRELPGGARPGRPWPLGLVTEHEVNHLARAVMELAAQFPAVDVDFHAVHDRPVDALLRYSAGAGLLVVGSRGLAPLASVLRGSVSQGLIGRAHCAVAVVRGPPRV
ncbi:universal stress protein [Georgenia yuyongxinii]|uniref:Universal stress protein n=2 Tax=Georgenia yuyongxinii TaxID=2589797 RepID=A0A5B8C326_9MICO|nr:universal stress protein [Georgenia yuyongxinii]